MYLFEDEDGMEFMVEEYVDPLDYDPEGYTSKQAGAGIASGINFKLEYYLLQREVSKL